MRHHAQDFQKPFIMKAYQSEENDFIKTVSVLHKSALPITSKVVSSHTMYQLEINDYSTLKLKTRIATHDNEDRNKSKFKLDCNICSLSGVINILSIAAIMSQRLVLTLLFANWSIFT